MLTQRLYLFVLLVTRYFLSLDAERFVDDFVVFFLLRRSTLVLTRTRPLQILSIAVILRILTSIQNSLLRVGELLPFKQILEEESLLTYRYIS